MSNTSEQTSQDQQGEYFSRWYERNKDEVAARRRERYHSDPDYRERTLQHKRERARERRAEIAPFVEKEFNGERYLVLRIGDVAARAGVTPFVVRDWESRGWIPKPSFPGHHRYYSDGQADLLAEFAADREVDVEAASAKVHANWTKE